MFLCSTLHSYGGTSSPTLALFSRGSMFHSFLSLGGTLSYTLLLFPRCFLVPHFLSHDSSTVPSISCSPVPPSSLMVELYLTRHVPGSFNFLLFMSIWVLGCWIKSERWIMFKATMCFVQLKVMDVEQRYDRFNFLFPCSTLPSLITKLRLPHTHCLKFPFVALENIVKHKVSIPPESIWFW